MGGVLPDHLGVVAHTLAALLPGPDHWDDGSVHAEVEMQLLVMVIGPWYCSTQHSPTTCHTQVTSYIKISS